MLTITGVGRRFPTGTEALRDVSLRLESGDFLAQDRKLKLPKKDDLLAVQSAGAYGMVMASNYNQRGRAAEVLVSGTKHWVTRKRETWTDLLRGESIPKGFK